MWIDLHGAPGSQNGFDNSGLRGGVGWMNGNGYVTHTKQVIRMLAKRFSKPEFAGVVSAIELLNERKILTLFESELLLTCVLKLWVRRSI